jgi:hypothetical protein
VNIGFAGFDFCKSLYCSLFLFAVLLFPNSEAALAAYFLFLLILTKYYKNKLYLHKYARKFWDVKDDFGQVMVLGRIWDSCVIGVRA